MGDPVSRSKDLAILIIVCLILAVQVAILLKSPGQLLKLKSPEQRAGHSENESDVLWTCSNCDERSHGYRVGEIPYGWIPLVDGRARCWFCWLGRQKRE